MNEGPRRILVMASNQYERNIQNRVADKENQKTKSDKSQSSHISKASFREDIALARFLLVGIRVVEPIILFHVFWKQ